SKVIVHFRSQAGDAVALWRSPKVSPVVDHQYEVELDTSVVLRDQAVTSTITSSARTRLERVGSKTHLIATVESLDEDGMAYLRLAPDCILMVESEGQSIHPGITVALDLEATDLEVTQN
ncbi:MAG TPA: hypothetical protein VFW23_12120, partial [Tepidisphaeraceae bacterium]|nr:hypothetical protein [Tepidisphaeraceae bacterium]